MFVTPQIEEKEMFFHPSVSSQGVFFSSSLPSIPPKLILIVKRVTYNLLIKSFHSILYNF